MKTSHPNPAMTGSMIACRLLALLAGLAVIQTAYAAPPALHDPDAIRASVRAFLADQVQLGKDDEIRVEALDERLRLAKCTVQTEHYLPAGTRLEGRLVVGSRCEGEQRWSIFVPVEILRYAEVAVLTRPLARGELLSADTLQMQRYNLNDLHGGYFLAAEQVLGQTLKYPMSAGTVLIPGSLQPAIKVRRGDIVKILAKKGPIYVKMQGKALADGAEGQRIRVLNHASKRIIEGTISYDGNIEVGL